MVDVPVNKNLNDNGHSIYPKYVYPNGIEPHRPGVARTEGVLVNSKTEEDEVMKPTKNKTPTWGN